MSTDPVPLPTMLDIHTRMPMMNLKLALADVIDVRHDAGKITKVADAINNLIRAHLDARATL